MKFIVEINEHMKQIFSKVLGTEDPKMIADELHKIILAELEWNSNYSKHFKGSEAEFSVYAEQQN